MTPLAVGIIADGRDGAIAQLGERVVRNDEVGGSIPPGSTNLLNSATRLEYRPSNTRKETTGPPEGCASQNASARFYFPVNRGGRFSTKLATPSRKSSP